MKYYDSKHSGAVAEQMLDDYAGGKLGGEGGAKVYNFDLNAAAEAGAVTQDVYDAIIAADVITADGALLDKTVIEGTIRLYSMAVSINDDGDTGELVSGAIVCTIGTDLSFTAKMMSTPIPTKTSQLTNDSGFITAADLPPSGGLPTEVIELSSEITMQEGKMLEIDMSTPVTGSLSLRHPTIEDPTQGLLFGIRFYCGESVPQLTFTGGFALSGIWANGELPQLEPNSMIEILGCATAGPYRFYLLTWAIYKA